VTSFIWFGDINVVDSCRIKNTTGWIRPCYMKHNQHPDQSDPNNNNRIFKNFPVIQSYVKQTFIFWHLPFVNIVVSLNNLFVLGGSYCRLVMSLYLQQAPDKVLMFYWLQAESYFFYIQCCVSDLLGFSHRSFTLHIEWTFEVFLETDETER
jgi:hypothetical protein